MNPWLDFWQKLILVGVGFLLTTTCGALITAMVSKTAWRRQARNDLFGKRYAEGVALHDELADIIGERFFALQRLHWAIRDTKNEYDLKEVRESYFRVIGTWNRSVKKYRSKIRVLVGEREALAFLDYADDGRGDAPKSLHYHFVVLGRAAAQGVVEQGAVDRLNHHCSRFIESLTTVFVERSNRLALLDPLDPPTYPSGFEDRSKPTEP